MTVIDHRAVSGWRPRLTQIAGWLAIGFGVTHVVVAPLDTRDTWSRVVASAVRW